MQVVHLVSVWLSGGEESKALHQKLDEKIDSYAAGELGHAVETVSSIWDLAGKRKAPSPIPKDKSGSPPNFPDLWWRLVPRQRGQEGMRPSLVKSIQGGSFLHRKYWVRRSRGGRTCPIYFPSAVSGLILSRAATCEWNVFYGVASVLTWAVVKCYEGGGCHLEESGEYEFSEDSDCESECELAGNPVSGNAEADFGERGQKLLPVLKVGSLVS